MIISAEKKNLILTRNPLLASLQLKNEKGKKHLKLKKDQKTNWIFHDSS
jgi:hypothetical protein